MMALSVAGRIQALSVCPVFSRVPSSDLGVLAEMLATERLDKGESLFEYGDPGDRVYVVQSGKLSVWLPGTPAPVRAVGAGDLLGEYGMFSSQGRTAAVKADTDAVLLSLDYARFRAFLLHFPESMLVVLKTAVERLTDLEASSQDK